MSVLDQYLGSSDDPTTIANAKNSGLNRRINDTLTRYDTVSKDSSNALADYIASYFGNTKTATSNTGQEVGNINRYFDGGAASDLAGLRATRSGAVNNAADLASQYALANLSRSRAGGAGGPSSYDTRMALRNTGDIATQAAVDDATQARNDWSTLEQQRLGLTGARTNLLDQLAARPLAPANMERQMLGQDLGILGQIGGVDQANTFYGLKNHPGIGEGFTSDYGSVMDAS